MVFPAFILKLGANLLTDHFLFESRRRIIFTFPNQVGVVPDFYSNTRVSVVLVNTVAYAFVEIKEAKPFYAFRTSISLMLIFHFFELIMAQNCRISNKVKV